MTPPLTIVAAVAENGVIGDAGAMPWRLATDLARYKRITLGKPMIVGRKTHDAIGRPLPGRRTIVVTRDPGRVAGQDVDAAASFEEALAIARRRAAEMGADEIIIAGGAEIYRLALPLADRLRLTIIHARPEGDTRFPVFDPADFRVIDREAHPAGPRDDHSFEFVDHERVARGATG